MHHSFDSSPLQLGFGDTEIPGSNNEIITLERFDSCYRISSKATNVESLKMDYRTFTLDFGDKFSKWDVPVMAVLYATSFENSFGVESQEFYHGKREVAQIILNHETTMSFKVKRTEVLKEKHTDCNEETYWEVLEKKLYPKIVENCTNPCFSSKYPGGRLPVCTYDDGGDYFYGDDDTMEGLDDDDFDCAKEVTQEVLVALGDFYNFKSCNIEEYEGKVIKDNLIPGKQEFYHWLESDKEDWEITFPENYGVNKNPGNLTIKFSYMFDSPQTMTVEVENYIVTFFDLMGIVGGTLGLFIGFAFYDNIIKSVEYLILIVNWIMRKRKAVKVSDLEKSSKQEAPKEETPKEEMPKEEMPKEEVPKDEVPKEEVPKEVPKEETPKPEVPKEENPEEEIPKQETAKEPQFQA